MRVMEAVTVGSGTVGHRRYQGASHVECGASKRGGVQRLTVTGKACATCWGPGLSVDAALTQWNADVEAAKTDLYERAMTLGYGSAAWRIADCFGNWDMVSDSCPKHPNHSTTMRNGYRVDDCAACEVIALSDLDGYYPGKWADLEAARKAEFVKLAESEIAAARIGECVCYLIVGLGAENLPAGGRHCPGCGSVFTPTGTDASPEVSEASERVQRSLDLNKAALAHWSNATSDDPERAYWDSPVYRESERVLRNAFTSLYPTQDYGVFQEIMSDNMPTDSIVNDVERVRGDWPGWLETARREVLRTEEAAQGEPVTLSESPATRAALEESANLAADRGYRAATHTVVKGMAAQYIRQYGKTSAGTAYVAAMIDAAMLVVPGLTQDEAQAVVSEALADAFADMAD